MQTQRERKRERSRRRTHSSDREPRNCQTHSSPIVANPEISTPFVKPIHLPEIIPPNHRSACSGSFSSPIYLLSLISDFLVVVVVAWVVLVLLFSDFGLIFDLMIFFLLGIENLGFVGFDDIFVWKLRKCEKHDKNGFSRAFSRIQPSTRKYFPKYFLKCNKTLENIFLS